MCFPGPSAPSLAKEHEHACSCSFVSSWVEFGLGLGLGLGQEGGEAAKHTWLPGHTLLELPPPPEYHGLDLGQIERLND